MSRTILALKNVCFGIGGKILNLILAFALRTVFIYTLGNTLLGVNSLYTEILMFLSFVELGFGSALTFSLYGPIAQNDYSKIIQILDFYKRVYYIIAVIVLILGLSLLPFLNYLVKGADFLSIFELRLYFCFFLLNTVVGYFVAYKINFVNAVQKNYIVSNFETVTNAIIAVCQLTVLLVTRNFLYYLITFSILMIISKVVLLWYLNEKFPLLKSHSDVTLSIIEKKEIYREVRGLAYHQFSAVAIHSTDNMIISALSGLGVAAVGLVSNYNMIIRSVEAFLLIIFNNFMAGFGNLAASENQTRFKTAFLTANLINFWLYAFASICFFCLIPPFITIWLGQEYLIDNKAFLLIVVNCFYQGQSTIYNSARIARGEFNRDKWVAFIQALINLLLSILGAVYYGLIGVFFGTVISRLFYVVFRPLLTYRFLFGCSVVEYYKKTFYYSLLFFFAGTLTYLGINLIQITEPYLNFLKDFAVVIVVPNVIFILFFRNKSEFRDLLSRIITLFYLKKKS